MKHSVRTIAVVVAAAIVAALAALWTLFGATLATALDDVVNSI